MAKLTIDISGRRGLLEGFQGDKNVSAVANNLRYLGQDGQFADGIFNPLRTYGYLSPANAKYAALTGTIAANIISIQYDSENDDVLLAEAGSNILKLDGLSDTSLSNYLSITSGDTIKDMLLYEMYGKPAVLYVIDSNDAVTYTTSSVRTGGMYVGFSMITSSDGLEMIDNNITDDDLGTGELYHTVVSAAGVSGWGGPNARKLAQQFNTSDFNTGTTSATNPSNGYISVSGVEFLISREGGTGAGITMKVSIQTAASASTSPYTSRGAWSNAVTNYAVNDTVTNGGFTWQCIKAHDASATASEEPGVGSNWEEYWNRFGAPSGTEVVSATFSLSSVSNLAATSRGSRYKVTFSSIANLSPGTEYWLVLEESGSVMSGTTDKCTWMSTVNGGGVYQRYSKAFQSTLNRWENLNINGDTLTAHHDDFDFKFVLNRQDDWSAVVASGKFNVDTGQSSFLYLSENALLYWFAGNKVHAFDGGVTGGVIGRAIPELLQFPSYLEFADVAETRSQMYIGLQDAQADSDDRHFASRDAGIFIWNRQSQVLGGTDFYPAVGAKSIKSVFVSGQGNVLAITVNDAGYAEIRGVSGNQYGVIQTFERLGYPTHRRAVTHMNGTTLWTGKNGIKYAYGAVAAGEPEQLYKIGDESGEYGTSVIQGAAFVGHENSSVPQTAVLSAWTDNGGAKVKKWYPHGVGTISSVAQTGNQGNVYTKVYDFGIPVNVEWSHVYFIPVSGGSSATTSATIKVYFNKSATVAQTFTITQADLAKGYFYMLHGKKNIFAVQYEIEWSTSQTLGSYDFQPEKIVVEYNDGIIKKK